MITEKKSQITDISTFCYWLHQKGVGIYESTKCYTAFVIPHDKLLICTCMVIITGTCVYWLVNYQVYFFVYYFINILFLSEANSFIFV